MSLRWWIEKQTDDGPAHVVSRETVFRTGDRIRLGLQTNQPAHLYVLAKTTGEDGDSWERLFPNPEYERGDNRILGYQQKTTIPPSKDDWDAAFEFEDPPESIELTVLLSREPVAELERVMYRRKSPPDRRPQPPKGLLAQNSPPVIRDAMYRNLTSDFRARKLVFAKQAAKDHVDKDELGPNVLTDGSMAQVNYVFDESADGSKVWETVTLRHE